MAKCFIVSGTLITEGACLTFLALLLLKGYMRDAVVCSFVLGIVGIIAWGMWKGQRRALWGSIIIAVLGCFLSWQTLTDFWLTEDIGQGFFYGFIGGAFQLVVYTVVLIGPPLWIIYFLRPSVKSQFSK